MGTSNLKLKLKLKAKENNTNTIINNNNTKTSSTPKCLSSIFHHIACSTNLPHSPSSGMRLIGHDYSKSINTPTATPNPNPKTTTTTTASCSGGTPGLVARLMGLESMPSFDNRQFRSKSLNSLDLNSDYHSRITQCHDNTPPRHSCHRRAQTSTTSPLLLQDHHLLDPILLQQQVQSNFKLGVSTNSPTVLGRNIQRDHQTTSDHHHHHQIERNLHYNYYYYYNVKDEETRSTTTCIKYPRSPGSKYATTTTSSSNRSSLSLSNKAGDHFYYCKTETMAEKKEKKKKNIINIRTDNDNKETKRYNNNNNKMDKNNEGKTRLLLLQKKKDTIISTSSRAKTLGNKKTNVQNIKKKKKKPHIDLLSDQTQKSPVSVLDQEDAFHHLSSGSSPETDVKSSQPRPMASSSVTVQSQRTKPVRGKNKKKTDGSSSPPRTSASGTKNKTEQQFQGFVPAQIRNLSQQYITQSNWLHFPMLDHNNVDDLYLDLAHAIFDVLLDHLVGDLRH